MFLLQTRSKFWDTVELFENRDEAIAKGREFVGKHNPVDSCSTEPVEVDNRHPVLWTCYRSSSFGLYQAWVHSATTTEPRPIFAIA